MPEPLSTVAAVVGVTVPALHATRLLINDINNTADAPNAVARLQLDLVSVEAAHRSLQSIQDDDWNSLGGDIASQAKATVASCEKSCASLHADLKRWTRHSEEGTLSKPDRVNIGFFRERQLRAMSDQLQTTKLTFTSIVSTATLYSTFRNKEVTDAMRGSITATADAIRAASLTAEDKLRSIEDSLALLSVQDATFPEDVEDRTSAIRQIEEDSSRVAEAQTLLRNLQPKVTEEGIRKAVESPEQSVNVSFGANNRGMQVGVSHGTISGITFGGK